MTKTTLTIKETSEFTGMSQSMLRVGLQQGIFHFGYAVKINSDKDGKFTYNIQKRGVEEYVGLSYDKWLESRKGAQI